jgi:NADH-quinone oxidoreductase subunit I
MKNLLKDIKALISGMGITGKHLGRHAITIQYPEERMEMFERSRGVVVLLSDKETGELNCTSCMLCMRACPTAAIHIDSPRGEDKKRVLKQFDIDFSLCCFCGLCEESCNFDAIKLAPKYEFSTLTKAEHLWDMHKLQEVGRDVPYEVTRKKKPAAKPKTDAKPAATAETAPANPGAEKKGDDAEPKAKAPGAAPENEKKTDEGGN